MAGHWERRWHPLLEQWVIIASTSAARPWSGAVTERKSEKLPVHDPGCYLCPSVVRASGGQNPDYRGPFAFDNDFPSLSLEAPDVESGDTPLERCASARGICRVLCWSERHDATLANLPAEGMLEAARLWQQEYRQLGEQPVIRYIQMFENKGTEIGVSNLHPHGQIYACGFIPETADRLRQAQARYADAYAGRSLLGDMIEHESVTPDLIVDASAHWRVIVPFAARFAFETWIVPCRAMASISDASDDELADFAACYQRQVRRYDVLFERSAPNITLLYNAPCDGHTDNRHWRFHLVFQPPLRDPQKMKFLAGFESGAGNIINPLQPEQAAARLRAIDLEDWHKLGLDLKAA